MLSLEAGGTEHGVMLVDMSNNGIDLVGQITEMAQCPRHGAVDEAHRTAADQSLELDQPKIRFDSGGVAVHQETDGACGGENGGLGVAHAIGYRALAGVVPCQSGGIEDAGGGKILVNFGGGTTMLFEHTEHVLTVGVEAGERPHALSKFGGGEVGLTGHERGDRTSDGATVVGVVGHAERHQHCAEVGVAEAELTERASGLRDLRRGVVGVSDQDLLGGEHDPDRVGEAFDVECIGAEFFGAGEKAHQVERSKIARRVIEVHVFTAGVAAVDAAGVGGGVPVVDRGVELDTWVGAFPRSFCDLAEQCPCFDCGNRVAVDTADEIPIGVINDSIHKLVGDPNRVVGVLVLNGVDVGAVERHVKPGGFEGAGLALLSGLAPDELFDIRMVGIEDHHFGGTAGLATRLDGAGRCIGAAHEADWAASGAPTFEQFGRAANIAEIDARTASALEDAAFLGVPVKDRVHVVVDREDEAGRRLLGHALNPNVEPDGRVEGNLLGDQKVGEFSSEGCGL